MSVRLYVNYRLQLQTLVNGRITENSFFKYLKIYLINFIRWFTIHCWNLLNVITIVYKSMLNYLKERTKYQQTRLILKVFIVTDFIFCIKTSTKHPLFPSTHISSKLSLKKLKIRGMEQLDNLIDNQHIKKQQEAAQRECNILLNIQIRITQ